MSAPSRSGGGGDKKGGYSEWIPSKFSRKHEKKKIVENPILGKREKGKERSNLSTITDFKNILSGGGRMSYITRVEKLKKREAIDRLATGTNILGADRESFKCPLRIMSLSNSIMNKLDCGPDSGPSYLEIVRMKPEYLLRFSQGGNKYVNFLYSELDGMPKINKKTCVIDFSFIDVDDGERKWLKVRFGSRSQFLQLVNRCERYLNLIKQDPKTYEPELDDISRNLGGPVDAKKKKKKVPFHKKEVLTWNEEDIKQWLKLVPFQEYYNGEITTLYERIEEKEMFPKKNSSMTQKSARRADFMQFHYDRLVLHFALQEEKAEDESEGEDEDDTKRTYLETLFEGEGSMLETFKFEVKMMENNAISEKDKRPYFNYNFHQVLRKKLDDGGSDLSSLLAIRNRLLVDERYLWSVMDCIDHILCLMLNKSGVEEWIDRLELEFEGVSEKRVLGTPRTMHLTKWLEWHQKLKEFNLSKGVVLEELSYNVWLDNHKKEFSVVEDRNKKEFSRLGAMIKKAKREGAERSEITNLEKQKKKVLADYKKVKSDKSSFECSSSQEEQQFLISEIRRKRIQKNLLSHLISRVKDGMFDMGVKTVLSLLPSEEEENFEQMFKGNMTKLGLKFAKFFGKKPSFAKFGFCHSSITVVNLAIHWFSNSLIMMEDLKDDASLYEEIIAMEAGCPTLVYGHIKSAYDQIFQLARFIVTANVEYEYTFMGSLRDDGKSNKVNCQQVTVRLLKMLNYTKYDEEVKEYVDQFIDEFSKMGATKPKNTNDTRWLPLNTKFYLEFVKKFEKQILEFVKKKDPKIKKVPERVYFNSRQEVCDFAILLMDEDRFFDVNHPGVYQLLKGFDRAFQIQNQKVKVMPFSLSYQESKD